MRARVRALFRLLSLQASWNYERMQGIGMAFAELPLLEEVAYGDAKLRHAAIARAAEFFNANPYLASAAIGASIRAERDGEPSERISRLRTALCGPLGALGDQLFWVGSLPALLGLTLLAIAWGAGAWAVLGFLLAHNALRLSVHTWAFDMGLTYGVRVGGAIQASWLPKAVAVAGPAAGFLVGLAAPLSGAWLLERTPTRGGLLIASGIAVALLIVRRIGWRLSTAEVTLGLLALAILWDAAKGLL